MTTRIPAAALLAALAAFAMPAFAKGDAEAGKAKSVPCHACHGEDGASSIDPQYPRLAGQYRDYLVRALHEYKSGKRDNAIMAGFATTLSEQDIEDLAAYYSKLPAKVVDIAGLH